MEPLEMQVRLVDTFATESVERPKYKHVERAFGGVSHHRAELGALGLASGFMVLILDDDGPALR